LNREKMPQDNVIDAQQAPAASSPVDEQVSAFLRSIDKRTLRARHYAAVLDNLIADLGGADRVSTAEVELARRCAVLSVLAGAIDKDAVEGKPVDIAGLCAITNALQRCLNRIGLKRVPRDVTPSLRDLLSGEKTEAA